MPTPKFTPGTDEENAADYAGIVANESEQQAAEQPTAIPTPSEDSDSADVTGIDKYLKPAEADVATATTAANAAKENLASRLIASGNPFISLLASKEPQREEDKEKRMRRAAKIQAFGNMLNALTTGVIGLNSKSGKGYVPKTDTSGPETFISNLNKLEDDYKQQHRRWEDLMLSAQGKLSDTDLAYAMKEEERAYADVLSKQKRVQALNDLALQRELSTEEREEKAALERDTAQWQALYNRDMNNHLAAVAYAGYKGSLEDFQKLPSAEQNTYVQKAMKAKEDRATDAKVKERKASRSVSTRSGSTATVVDNTFPIDDKGGKITINAKILNDDVNLQSVYDAMITDNKEFAAKGKAHYGGFAGKDVVGYDAPTKADIVAALVANIRNSPKAQERLQELGGIVSTASVSTPENKKTIAGF